MKQIAVLFPRHLTILTSKNLPCMWIVDNAALTVAPYHLHHSTKAAKPEWHQIFLRGIGCNWLVSVAVWVSSAFILPSYNSLSYISASRWCQRDDFEGKLTTSSCRVVHTQQITYAGSRHLDPHLGTPLNQLRLYFLT
jgi:hypothetical protein